MNRSLNERQLAVLRWIGDGCPAGVMPDSGHKHSAVALRDRGLATVSKRSGWHAEITAAGRHYLEHGDYPVNSKPRRASATTSASTATKPRRNGSRRPRFPQLRSCRPPSR
jgi:hypothetical protein